MKNNDKNDIGAPESLADANAQLRVQLQDLEAYIAGRKSRWEAMRGELAAGRDAVASLESALTVRNARINNYARTTAKLERRIESQARETEWLRERLTQARRRSAPPDAPRAHSDGEVKLILRAAYDKLAAMRREQTRLQGELAEKDEYIDQLCGRMTRLETDRNATLEELARQRKIIARIETDIRARLTRVALSSRKPAQRRAITASIMKLDERRARLEGRIDVTGFRSIGRLTQIDASGHTVEHALGARTVTIGRGDHNDICIAQASVSREHARLTPASDGIVIEDLCSRNGTRVNDRPVARQRLRSGDIVAVGQARFRYSASIVAFSRPSAS